jgi:hypothetical protein
MLDLDAQERAARELIARLPCNVELPADVETFFRQAGLAPACLDDQRRTQRVRCGSAELTAALEYQQTLPAVPRGQGWHRVYIVDLSKRGIGFFHSEQLFPGESMRIVLLTGDCRRIEIVRCRRLAARCFRLGAEFITQGESRWVR